MSSRTILALLMVATLMVATHCALYNNTLHITLQAACGSSSGLFHTYQPGAGARRSPRGFPVQAGGLAARDGLRAALPPHGGRRDRGDLPRAGLAVDPTRGRRPR